MFTTSKRCAFCDGPLPFGMFVFCCNECQRCFHRARGTAPSGWSKQEFRDLCREQQKMLDDHERKVNKDKRR
ncbi:hypothetical protein CHLRE_08g377650v5 [Chlamydomonas reinhardtii]|uniref:Uncharacterized protein n=1 Tax=Chlamydomonas reinhardtii TaxID=3055 RepID=A0A2K3DHU0_CHLRE|nr:uncharacterized protein CHLRE_08g377650v5 [Chlamydomonas reinhardtii]PNW80094.1 hypothetical protein CHLRE_08g377650v5 [Chlamydomonas reinhardtii]